MADIRILLNDRSITDLKAPSAGQYRARDTQLKGFHVIVGRRTKTFAVQGDLRKDGKRVASISVRIGDVGPRPLAKRARPRRRTSLRYPGANTPIRKPLTWWPAEMKLHKLARTSQRGVRMMPPRKGSPYGKRGSVITTPTSSGKAGARCRTPFKDWLDAPLQELADDPAKVIARHDELTKQRGPYIANGSMRTLRAVYNHARKAHRYLPADNPASVVDWNSEERRNTAMGLNDLPHWFQEERRWLQSIAKHNRLRWQDKRAHIARRSGGCFSMGYASISQCAGNLRTLPL